MCSENMRDKALLHALLLVVLRVIYDDSISSNPGGIKHRVCCFDHSDVNYALTLVPHRTSTRLDSPTAP